MPFPSASERQEALLCLIYLRGGPRYKMRSSDTYRPLADFFGLTKDERERQRDDRNLSRRDRREWNLKIQDSREALIGSKWVIRSKDAIWRLTKPAGVEQAKRCLECNPDLYRLRSTINVEDQDLSEDELDHVIRTNQLRIGMVHTHTQEAQVRQQRGRAQIRKLTVEYYEECCAVCDVTDPDLLIVSHIVRWRDEPEHSGDLTNVICLCRMHDALFEFGYWSLGDSLELLKKESVPSKTVRMLLDEMTSFRLPVEYRPAACFVRGHRERTGFSTQR
jgi:hypothetical protein